MAGQELVLLPIKLGLKAENKITYHLLRDGACDTAREAKLIGGLEALGDLTLDVMMEGAHVYIAQDANHNGLSSTEQILVPVIKKGSSLLLTHLATSVGSRDIEMSQEQT